MKALFAIFGDPVAHSRSPLMHNHLFHSLHVNACYTRIHLQDGSQLRETFFKLGLSGANVTVPHKEAAYDACDEVRGFAKHVGVVNTLINENGRLIGYNTDADGFMFAIRHFENIKSVLVLGAGGTSKALTQRFANEGYTVTVLNRSAARLEYFKELNVTVHTWESFEADAFDLVLNTTSAGLKTPEYPAPLQLLEAVLKQSRYGADAIYGTRTPFLELCDTLKIPSIDGLEMLLGQGVLANRIFTAQQYDAMRSEAIMRESFSF